MGEANHPAIVLDAGALIAFERGSSKMRALVREARLSGTRMLVPAGALAQAWRDPRRQVRLGVLLREVVVIPLERTLAEASGILCGRTGSADIADASVVLVARRERAGVIVTSDAGDLRRLDPSIAIERV